MAEHDDLLEVLGRALTPAPVEPPAYRVAAVRRRAVSGRLDAPSELSRPWSAPEPVGPSNGSSNGHGNGVPDTSPWSPRRTPVFPTVPSPSPRGPRTRWVAAVAALAAAVLLLGLIAVPAVSSRHRSQHAGGGATPARAAVLQAVQRLQLALDARDPAAVERADADLVRLVGALSASDRTALDDAVARARRAADDFLRTNPSPGGAPNAPSGGSATGGSGSPGGQPGTPGSGSATSPAPGPAASPPAVVPPAPPSAPTRLGVAIVAVNTDYGGTFRVDFVVTGFTPDASGTPGTYAVKFFFDNGDAPTVYGGPSPWSFPIDNGVYHQRVCAQVVDAAQQVVPGGGSCHKIL